jgi:hypothetical protein
LNLPDLVNGAFECSGGVFTFANCARLYRDKAVRGVFIPATVMFTAWGFWNLFYYPHLDQWMSFAGGVVIVIGNSIWVTMALCYARRAGGQS